MSDAIHQAVQSLQRDMVDWRRHFHQYPELGLEEHKTAAKIAEILTDLKMDVKTGVGLTGVTATLAGTQPGKTLLLRADMDALPIAEENDVPYKSRIDGCMHACGHDGHVAILLGAAKYFRTTAPDFPGTIKFVFQPGEEGFGGAKLMIDDGAMTSPDVDATLALHLISKLPTGVVGVKTGAIMASADWFHVTFRGRGGHAAMPEQGIDTVLMSAHAITALQALISKETSPTEPLVIHVGTINGGRKFNIIAESVEISGTVRTLNETLHQAVPEKMNRVLGGVAAAFGGSHDMAYVDGYPMLINDPAMTEIVRGAARMVVDENNVVDVPPNMGADDMAFFQQLVPGSYFMVGCGNSDKGTDQAHHCSLFNVDEDALAIGAETMIRAALDYLQS